MADIIVGYYSRDKFRESQLIAKRYGLAPPASTPVAAAAAAATAAPATRVLPRHLDGQEGDGDSGNPYDNDGGYGGDDGGVDLAPLLHVLIPTTTGGKRMKESSVDRSGDRSGDRSSYRSGDPSGDRSNDPPGERSGDRSGEPSGVPLGGAEGGTSAHENTSLSELRKIRRRERRQAHQEDIRRKEGERESESRRFQADKELRAREVARAVADAEAAERARLVKDGNESSPVVSRLLHTLQRKTVAATPAAAAVTAATLPVGQAGAGTGGVGGGRTAVGSGGGSGGSGGGDGSSTAASTDLSPGGVDTASAAAAAAKVATELHHAIGSGGGGRRRSIAKGDSTGGHGGLNVAAPDFASPPLATKGKLATGAASAAAVWDGDGEKKRHSIDESAVACLRNPDISSSSTKMASSFSASRLHKISPSQGAGEGTAEAPPLDSPGNHKKSGGRNSRDRDKRLSRGDLAPTLMGGLKTALPPGTEGRPKRKPSVERAQEPRAVFVHRDSLVSATAAAGAVGVSSSSVEECAVGNGGFTGGRRPSKGGVGSVLPP